MEDLDVLQAAADFGDAQARKMRERLNDAAPDLLEACKAALYLLGKDADRAYIGMKPWSGRGAESVPDILRAAIAQAEGKDS